MKISQRKQFGHSWIRINKLDWHLSIKKQTRNTV